MCLSLSFKKLGSNLTQPISVIFLNSNLVELEVFHFRVWFRAGKPNKFGIPIVGVCSVFQ